MDPNHLGCFAEYLFASECTKRGFVVSMPILDSSVYDCIIDVNGSLKKIQIKSTQKTPLKHRKSVQVPLRNDDNKYTIEKIDWFCIYCEYFNGFFNFPNTGNMQSIRLSTTGKSSKYFNNFVFNSN